MQNPATLDCCPTYLGRANLEPVSTIYRRPSSVDFIGDRQRNRASDHQAITRSMRGSPHQHVRSFCDFRRREGAAERLLGRRGRIALRLRRRRRLELRILSTDGRRPAAVHLFAEADPEIEVIRGFGDTEFVLDRGCSSPCSSCERSVNIETNGTLSTP